MRIRNKLLLSFIAVIVLIVLAGFFVLRWSFERGVFAYIVKSDMVRLESLAGQLADYFAKQHSWRQFNNDPREWVVWVNAHDLSNPLVLSVPPPIPADGAQNKDNRPPDRALKQYGEPEHGSSGFQGQSLPYFLLDENAKLVAGRKEANSSIYPVALKGTVPARIVGYVGLPLPPARMTSFWQEPIAEQQTELILFFSLGILLISIGVAIPLSALMTRRISLLYRYVSDLCDGKYQDKISLLGRDELALLGENLNKLSLTLFRSQQQRKQLTADIAHELRTPVAGLQSYIEGMQDDFLPLSKESLSKLHTQTQRLSKLIEDLYQLSLADDNAMSFTLQPCSISELLETLVSAHAPLFSQQNLSLGLQILSSESDLILADEHRLGQVFTNLLENSRRYTNAPGMVLISVDRNDDHLLVTVADSAPGVDPVLYPRLTERLFRVDPSRDRNSGGSGLGLNLCAAIVSAHDGLLQFNNSHLGGLSVSVKLPIYRSNNS